MSLATDGSTGDFNDSSANISTNQAIQNNITASSDDYQDGVDPNISLASGNFMNNTRVSEQDKELIIKFIDELKYSDQRDNALLELSRQREHFSELAPFIWHSVGTIAALLQEIVSVYPLLSPPLLDSKTSNKACNVLALLQCVASHRDTRKLFLKAHIPLFLYPFLNTVSKGRSFEYLRLTSLGVIGALVKMDDTEVISFLLQTEIIPLCLRIMERGTELSQTVATFIIQKILLDDSGLSYLCQTAERFFAVSTVLNNMVQNQLEKPSSRLLKHIIKCYYRLSENPRASMALSQNIPVIVRECVQSKNPLLLQELDESSKKCLKSLIEAQNAQQENNNANGNNLTNSIQNDGSQGKTNPLLQANDQFSDPLINVNFGQPSLTGSQSQNNGGRMSATPDSNANSSVQNQNTQPFMQQMRSPIPHLNQNSQAATSLVNSSNLNAQSSSMQNAAASSIFSMQYNQQQQQQSTTPNPQQQQLASAPASAPNQNNSQLLINRSGSTVNESSKSMPQQPVLQQSLSQNSSQLTATANMLPFAQQQHQRMMQQIPMTASPYQGMNQQNMPNYMPNQTQFGGFQQQQNAAAHQNSTSPIYMPQPQYAANQGVANQQFLQFHSPSPHQQNFMMQPQFQYAALQQQQQQQFMQQHQQQQQDQQSQSSSSNQFQGQQQFYMNQM